MEIGLLHLHRTLGYLVFFASLVNLVLVLVKARSDARAAAALHWVHQVAVLGAGRLNLVLGVAMVFLLPWVPKGAVWAWAGLLLWGPIEVVSKRLVKPEIAMVRDGGSASGRLLLGTAVELLIIVAIFGLMSARP